jgi:PAS domain S-box-containing protein
LYFGTPRNHLIRSVLLHREKNREHAKRSRVRKKFVVESLQQSVHALEEENEKLRGAIRQHVPKDEAEQLLAACDDNSLSVLSTKGKSNTRVLDDPDYGLVKALQTAQQNFVITDPAAPDNPIVFASQGFLSLTGYTLDQVLGRNCRFLQGPQTDARALADRPLAIDLDDGPRGSLLNYRSDGSTFWNQFFIAALRDDKGVVVNYLGVQCKVSEDYAAAFQLNEGHK